MSKLYRVISSTAVVRQHVWYCGGDRTEARTRFHEAAARLQCAEDASLVVDVIEDAGGDDFSQDKVARYGVSIDDVSGWVEGA